MNHNKSKTPIYSRTDTPEEVLQKHGGLVKRIANKYQAVGIRVGLDIDDLMQEGKLGLLRAHDGFEPAREVRFSTYATRVIDRAIHKAVQDHEFIRLPKQARSLLYRIKDFEDRFFAKHCTEPTDEQIENGLPPAPDEMRLFEHLLELRRWEYFETPPYSLETPVGENGNFTIGDFVTYVQSSDSPFGTVNGAHQIRDPDCIPDLQCPAPEAEAEISELCHLISLKLSPRDVQIFLWKYLYGYTHKEIAERLDVKNASTIGTWLDRARRSLSKDDSFREVLRELAVAS